MSFPQKQHKLPSLKNIRLIHLLHKFISCLLGYFARAVTFMGIFCLQFYLFQYILKSDAGAAPFPPRPIRGKCSTCCAPADADCEAPP